VPLRAKKVMSRALRRRGLLTKRKTKEKQKDMDF
jgi:hypothetical protein